ncbi:hypothetical protein [Sinanaerobacter sp. ZZT-01]|uniref:hypothetical protein n=1 Tax=Sinanaerobacter sp. ZZT-01 TaxID=3111540 RepID=UPI002D785F95|nr:hypothetical protein [Sinanaerobacter sp. ZZT-01]WRR94197.1 hypothetical protein U5921_03500 [Sinanaerobacter sp. ZZT-01]
MYKTRHTRQKLGVYCTPAQKLELELEYDFYKRKFNEDMELFLEAFIQRNKIFPVDVLKAPIDKELTAKEMQMLWIAEVLERHERKCLLE